jgi:class 3 adenylate cyclase
VPGDARFCPACGVEQAAPPPAKERKLATILFADLVGSTELGAQDPERTRELLDRFYDAMAAEVEAAGGTIEKFAGDAVMAAYGIPSAHEDHAERALDSSLSMLSRLDELFAGTLALRIGVNTGEVVVGRPREGSSFATGDAVNVAARLEQAAAPGEILVGERTVAGVGGAFGFGPLQTVQAKGKPEGVPARKLERRLTPAAPGWLPRLGRAFVGREDELAILQQTYQLAVEGGSVRLVTVAGDPGIGKSRLARELWQWLSLQSPQPVRRVGRCPAYGRARTYWPLSEILKEHLAISGEEVPDDVVKRLRGREILGLTLGLDVAGDLHPREARERLHRAWVDLFTELGNSKPSVVLIEDLHWAEEDLLELLARIGQEAQGPLLMLLTARPEFLDRASAWHEKANCRTLSLTSLSRANSELMLDELLPVALPARLRDVIVERAEGNPFFVEELLATLVDRGVVKQDSGSWSLERLPFGFELPDSVQGVLAARIDLLPAPAKATLQTAAVIGRSFWSGPLVELLDHTKPDFRTLAERQFIERRSESAITGEHEFVFKHALTREVAYAGLTKARRGRLHAAFADWLERVGGGRDEHASLIAHHFAEAASPDYADLAWPDEWETLEELRLKAVTWLRRAVRLAAGRYEIDDALVLLHQARVLETDRDTMIQLWLEDARMRYLKYDLDGARLALEAALALEPDRETAADTYAELAFNGGARPYVWQSPPARDDVSHWVARALELAPPGGPAHATALQARAIFEPRTGGAYALESVEIAERLGDPLLRGRAYEAAATVATGARRYLEAREWSDRQLAVTSGLPDPGARSGAQWHVAWTYLRAGDLGGARRLAYIHDELASKLTAHDAVHAVALRACVETAGADWTAARTLVARAERAATANAELPCQFNWRSLAKCALACAHVGDEQEAHRLEERAEDILLVGGPLGREPALLRLALLRGDLDTAERRLLQVPIPDEAWPWDVDAPGARLDALIALGAYEQAEEEAERFLDTEGYATPFALRTLGIVRREPAQIDAAIARFEAMGLDWYAEETRDLRQRVSATPKRRASLSTERATSPDPSDLPSSRWPTKGQPK